LRRIAAAALAVTGLVASPVLAQGVDEFGAYGGLEDASTQRSPQMWAIELRFGPYHPNVDAALGNGATPFADTFGNDRRVLFGFEVDWQPLRIPYVGSLGPGVGWHYTRFTADALLADGTGRAEQQTSLSIMPMYLVAVGRVDVLSRETVVPLSVYGKAGLGYALWWASDGEDTATDDAGVKGRDASYGLHWAVGAMLALNWLEPSSAATMDEASGVNNAHLFLEWYSSTLDGFGSGDQMNVGDNTWALGLVVEM
jgi:hypothetical protein